MTEMKSNGIFTQITTLPNSLLTPSIHITSPSTHIADDSLQCDLLSNFVPVLSDKHLKRKRFIIIITKTITIIL